MQVLREINDKSKEQILKSMPLSIDIAYSI